MENMLKITMSQKDSYGRKVFDLEKSKEKAIERKKADKLERELKKIEENAPKGPLKPLVANLDNINLTKGLNKREVYGQDVPINQIGQWSCPVCRLFFRNSSIYLNHLTSPEHNEKMGMSMKVPDTTDEEVISRVAQWEEFYSTGKEVPSLYDTVVEE